MATQKQLLANRLNALKSTGPRSVEGKARASMNALKTGIDARSQTIPGEPISQLEELTDDYYERFCPTTPEQRMLVDSLIDCEWLLRRFRRVEGQMWEHPNFEITFAKAFRKDSDHFARLQRRIDATQRNYRNALHELERLQAEQAEPASPAIETTKPEIGFVPQTPPCVPNTLLPARPQNEHSPGVSEPSA